MVRFLLGQQSVPGPEGHVEAPEGKGPEDLCLD